MSEVDTPNPAPTPTPPAPTPAPAPAPAPVPPAPEPVKVKGDADDYIRELRDEAKQRRIAAEELTGQVGTLTQERDSVTAERDNLARQNAVILAAGSLGANAAAILDSRALESKLAAVDPSDPEAVKTFITEAVEGNAAFKAGPVIPPRNGGGHQGGQTAAQPLSLDAAVKTALGG